MAFIDIDLPDDADTARDDLAARVLLVVFAGLVLQFGLKMGRRRGR